MYFAYVLAALHYLCADINMYLARIKLFARRWNGSDPHSFISLDILNRAYCVSNW